MTKAAVRWTGDSHAVKLVFDALFKTRDEVRTSPRHKDSHDIPGDEDPRTAKDNHVDVYCPFDCLKLWADPSVDETQRGELMQ